MNPGEFVKKWAASTVSERAASQSHFNDICALIGHQTPLAADPIGETFAFERGASKTTGGEGFADVWLRDHFGWEYKGKHKDLTAAYRQVVGYHEALGHPPLLVVCDMERFEIHTKWTNTESWIYRFRNADIATDDPVEVVNASGAVKDPPRISALEALQALFDEPERLKPGRTTDQITREAALHFGNITDTLRKYGVDDMRIARFTTRMLFCFFAADAELLPRGTITEIVSANADDANAFRTALSDLFRQMDKGGRFGARRIAHFNGRLFTDDDVPEYITAQEIRTLGRLDALNWADVEPAIFGTLFERVLDPSTRAKLGAHYTARTDIETLVEPVLMAPLRREWERVKGEASGFIEASGDRGLHEAATRERIASILAPFHDRMASTRVLDPACGSGNFLYVALALMKGLEKELLAFAGLHGVTLAPRVHPRQLFGIELNPYAHELASIVIWIGYLQWKWRNAFPFDDETPILQPLDQIELKDAILDLSDVASPREPDWPEADVILGNPPFLGGKRLRRELGDSYVDSLFRLWDGRVRREADLCCYWHEKARAAVGRGRAGRAGLLATQAIRGGASRATLERIKASGDIFMGVADAPWILDGAAVRISMVGFDDGSEVRRTLDGAPVEGINANLTSLLDLTTAVRLPENLGISFMGDTKVGPFEIDEATARRLLASPNPHGKPNSDVVRRWANGLSFRQRTSVGWIIDFPPTTTEAEASRYQAPFEHIEANVRPTRIANARSSYAKRWWVHGEPRAELRARLAPLRRYLVTVRHSKHRTFAWLPSETLPDSALIAFVREDDYFFGVLHSRAHEVWSRATGTQLREVESAFRYTPDTCFETFPLPWPPGNEPTDQPSVRAVAQAALTLDTMRQQWLNPRMTGGLGLPDSELMKRTLTALYTGRPRWLTNAHRDLDDAVFGAYGWPSDLTDQEILSHLLDLNRKRGTVSD